MEALKPDSCIRLVNKMSIGGRFRSILWLSVQKRTWSSGLFELIDPNRRRLDIILFLFLVECNHTWCGRHWHWPLMHSVYVFWGADIYILTIWQAQSQTTLETWYPLFNCESYFLKISINVGYHKLCIAWVNNHGSFETRFLHQISKQNVDWW